MKPDTKKVLFVCTANINRSKTAEVIFKDKFDTKSAGTITEGIKITNSLLEWADLIVVMEEEHRTFIGDQFPKQYLMKKIICLDIPDIFRYMQPELIILLNERMNQNE